MNSDNRSGSRRVSRCKYHCRVVTLVMLVTLACGGCSKAGPDTGELTGKVTFQSEIVGDGNVMLKNQEMGLAHVTRLNQDGSYRFENIRLADFVVIVLPRDTERTGQQFDSGGRSSVVKKVDPNNIPPRYRAAKTSPLRVTVTKGITPFDIELE